MVRVLAVDDEMAITEALADLLTTDDIKVDTAGNGRQALELMREHRYDLVLLDYMMPIMNGRETLQTIRNSEGFSSVKVVIMSAFSRHQLDLEGLRVDGILHKPFDLDAVFDLVNQARSHVSRDIP
jgi:DNA-binding response OmpR family regulator